MHPLPVTSMTVAIFALLMVVLSAQTSLTRVGLKVGHGDAGDETLRRRVRAHGNFAEYAPMALILLGLVEALGVSRATVLGLAIALVLARVLHAVGMLYTSRATLKAIAMLIQHTAFIFAAALLARMSSGVFHT
jgi:uncharacterized membrane protein YecN with MAPEG domain